MYGPMPFFDSDSDSDLGSFYINLTFTTSTWN